MPVADLVRGGLASAAPQAMVGRSSFRLKAARVPKAWRRPATPTRFEDCRSGGAGEAGRACNPRRDREANLLRLARAPKAWRRAVDHTGSVQDSPMVSAAGADKHKEEQSETGF